MRDPARIDRMTERLRELWHAQPDQRLGQLLVNVIRPGEPCPRVFHAEDTDTEAKLAKYPEPLADDSPPSGDVTLRLTRGEARALLAFLRRFAKAQRGTDDAEHRALRAVWSMLEPLLSDE